MGAAYVVDTIRKSMLKSKKADCNRSFIRTIFTAQLRHHKNLNGHMRPATFAHMGDVAVNNTTGKVRYAHD